MKNGNKIYASKYASYYEIDSEGRLIHIHQQYFNSEGVSLDNFSKFEFAPTMTIVGMESSNPSTHGFFWSVGRTLSNDGFPDAGRALKRWDNLFWKRWESHTSPPGKKMDSGDLSR